MDRLSRLVKKTRELLFYSGRDSKSSAPSLPELHRPHVASVPRKLLVIVQAALSRVLLSASGLLTTALLHLENQTFGFEQDRRTIVSFDPLLAGYRVDQLDALNRSIHDSLAGLPGVEAVALAWYSPQSGKSDNTDVFIAGHPAPGPKDDAGSLFDRITPGYFDAIGNRLWLDAQSTI